MNTAARPDDLCPAYRNRKKMGVTKWDVCGRNFVAANWRPWVSLRHRDPFVGQRRPANLREVIQLHHQPLAHGIKIRDLVERLPLAPLGSLAVTGVQQGQFMRLPRDRRRNAGIHPAAQQNHCLGLSAHRAWRRLPLLCLDAIPDPGDYTPRVAGCQMNLCNCSPRRTGKPSARIHSATSCAFIPGQVPSGSACTGENTT